MLNEKNARETAEQIVVERLESLQRSGMIGADVHVGPETILIGAGSQVDSLAFVTFIAELEDQLSREAGQDVPLILERIHEFNTGNSELTARALARYIASAVGPK